MKHLQFNSSDPNHIFLITLQNMNPIIVHLILAVLFSFSTLSYSAAAKARNKSLISSFSIDLIHRDSPLSPFYNSSLTPSERIIKAALRSVSRIKHFRRYDDDTAAPGGVIIPNRGDYLMKILFGTPPVEFHAAADTGSDLVWVPCLPCAQCDPQYAFDAAKSSTFMVLPCDSPPCSSLPKHACGNSKECRYFYRYGDQSYTIGDLATETISFDTGTRGNAPMTTVFGCGRDNEFAENTGIAGLGGGPLSLVSQLGDRIGHKFSYCLLPFSSNATSKLKFGNEATLLSGDGVVSTPLITKIPTTFYYVNLVAVTVGQKIIQTGQSGGNLVVDSGTTLTILESGFYDDLRGAVREEIGVEPVIDPPDPFDLCFRYESGMEDVGFVLHFTNAVLKLHPGNMFTFHDDLLCLLVIPSDRISILGNIAQINFQVAFDLEGKEVSFSPADCTVN